MDSEFNREESLGWLVAVVSSSMAKGLDAQLTTKNLRLKHWPTLMCLWERDGITQTELSNTVRVPGYTTTRTLDELEKLGLVERREDPNSRRAHNVHLTARGRRLQHTLPPLAQMVNESHLQALDTKERRLLIQLLKKIVASLDDD